MGVINITPDSFWKNSRYENDKAVDKCIAMSNQGAAWIDIGAESTRPDSTQLNHDEEWRRLKPFLTSIEGKIDKEKTKISIVKVSSIGLYLQKVNEIYQFINNLGFSNESGHIKAVKPVNGLPKVLILF